MNRNAPATQLLKAHFGFATFRPGQAEVVEAARAKRDVLAVMPTGAGKSLCYQLPALECDALTLVVSPLIALMKDQVEALQRRGIAAAALSSGVEAREQRRIMGSLSDLKLLYLSPERLGSDGIQRALKNVTIERLVIDEAHCISSWGHDFRPDYRRLGDLRRALGTPPATALTATATPRVQDDIAHLLDLHDPVRVLTGFDRPNLRYRVWAVPDESARLEALEHLLRNQTGPAIVYALTRSRVETLAAQFSAWGLRSSAYHAGLPADRRAQVHDAFLSSRDAVMVATNAFGMGVDKADVRQVIHAEMPASLEAYYQEAGRAGRDGAAATCTLLYSPDDAERQRRLLASSSPTTLDLKGLYLHLRNTAPEPLSTRTLELPRGKLVGALQLLKEGGIVHLERRGAELCVRLSEPALRTVPPFETLPVAAQLQRKLELLGAMTHYAEAGGCRREALLRYFGETPTPLACGCDRCAPTPELTESSLKTLQHFVKARALNASEPLPRWLLEKGYLEPRPRLWQRRYGLSARGAQALRRGA